jgi:GMP synthase (glutamine-hydrolysing)
MCWACNAIPNWTARTFERWLVGHALELAQTGVDVPALRAETAARSGTLARQAALAWRRWLAGVGLASAE